MRLAEQIIIKTRLHGAEKTPFFSSNVGTLLRARLHGAEKVPFFSSDFKPHEVNFSKSALKNGALLVHVDKPLIRDQNRS